VETSDAVRDEMLDLAERLAELDDEQWNSPSLCSEWRVRDVLAHMTAGAAGAFGVAWIFRSMLRHGFSYNRWVAVDGQVRGQQDPGITLEAFRNAATNVPAARPIRGLMHVLIHGQDICRPLGIARCLPEAHLLAVASFVKDDRLRFHTKRRIAGLTLRATDVDWSYGHGPEVTVPTEALIMTMAGRLIALDDLAGEGKPTLISRG
jgi:uncharacterized protein (TIGR03083 family)